MDLGFLGIAEEVDNAVPLTGLHFHTDAASLQ